MVINKCRLCGGYGCSFAAGRRYLIACPGCTPNYIKAFQKGDVLFIDDGFEDKDEAIADWNRKNPVFTDVKTVRHMTLEEFEVIAIEKVAKKADCDPALLKVVLKGKDDDGYMHIFCEKVEGGHKDGTMWHVENYEDCFGKGILVTKYGCSGWEKFTK